MHDIRNKRFIESQYKLKLNRLNNDYIQLQKKFQQIKKNIWTVERAWNGQIDWGMKEVVFLKRYTQA